MVEINRGIEGQREHFDNLGLHIGYVYGSTEIPANVSVFKPSCVPGARLPHAWIKVSPGQLQLPAVDCSYVHELSKEDLAKKQYSTLDLCHLDTFTLIVHESNAAGVQGMVERSLANLPQHIKAPPLKTVVYGVDFHLQEGGKSGSWSDLMRLEEQGILVCPDQHILACIPNDAGENELFQALKGHLGWD